MKKIFITLVSLAGLSLLASCNKPYDPIGPNRPAPVAIISPMDLGVSGEGGEVTASVSTNAESLQVGTLPEWVESATIGPENKSLTVKIKPNTDPNSIRRGVVPVTAVSGDNTITQNLKIHQAMAEGQMAFESFTAKTYNNQNWVADDPAALACGNGYLSYTSGGTPGVLMTCKQEYSPANAAKTAKNNFYFSVDMKIGQGEGGAQLYIDDDPAHVVEIYMGYNSSTGRGGIWVKNGPNWCAMDDGTVGSGDCPNKTEPLYPIPDASERDEWWRLVVTNIGKYSPDQRADTPQLEWQDAIVAVYSLKTFNGETKELLCHYARSFGFTRQNVCRAALWARNGECQFKNFTLAFQNK